MVRRVAIACAVWATFGSTQAAQAAAPSCAQRLLPTQTDTGAERRIAPRDLVELRDFGRTDAAVAGELPFTVSPDGRYAALILRRADPDADSYCFGVALVSLDGTGAVRLLDIGGEFIQSTADIRGVPAIASGLPQTAPPAWSPDGRWLAYLRRDHGSTQVWRVGIDGSPAVRLTGLPVDVEAVAWAADGCTLLVTSRPSLAEGMARVDREGRGGFLYDARFWALSEDRPRPPLPLPRLVQVIDVFRGNPAPIEPERVGRSAPNAATDRPAAAIAFAASPAGRAWTAYDDPALSWGPARLHVEVGGTALPCPADACSDHVAALWWKAPDELLFMRAGAPENGGRLQLYRWRVGVDAAPVRLFETGDALFGCQLAPTGMICGRETSLRPRTIVRLNPDTGATVTLFDPNPEFARLRLGQVKRLSWTDRQGVSTYGDLVLPPDHHGGDRHPLIVVQYISRGFLRGGTGDEYPIQLLADRGFAVLSFQMPTGLPARRAATDINALQRINIKDWAGRRLIFNALDAGIDAAVAQGVVDPDRIGITGLSDGSTTAQFALNNSDRFKAAVISSCCDEPSALFAVGPAYRDAVMSWGYPPPGVDDKAFWSAQSLTRNARRMHTPLLIEEPDMEYRLGLEAVSALQVAGAPVEMYVFPDEHHVKWHPAHRLAIYKRNLAWFDFWLRDEAILDPSRHDEIDRWQGMKTRRGKEVAAP